jgi:hypothetical protein
MDRSNTEQVVKTGTFHYGGLPICKVRIVQTDFRRGTGDYEDPEEWAADRFGTFFRIEYTPARSDRFSVGGGYCGSLEDAIRIVEEAVEGVVWDV